jgi:hypothetical protein
VILPKKKRPGNADTIASAGRRRVPPKPYWEPLDDNKEREGQDGELAVQSESKTAKSSEEKVKERKVTFRSRRRKRTSSLWEEIVNDGTPRKESGLPKDLKAEEGAEKNPKGDTQPDAKKRKLVPLAASTDEVTNSTSKTTMEKPETTESSSTAGTSLDMKTASSMTPGTPQATDSASTSTKRVTPEEEGLPSPDAIEATGKEAVLSSRGETDSNRLFQLLQYIPKLDQTLSAMSSLLKSIAPASKKIEQQTQEPPPSSAQQVDYRSIEREIRQQKSIQRLEEVCQRQEQALQRLENAQVSDNQVPTDYRPPLAKAIGEQANNKQSNNEIAKEIAMLREIVRVRENEAKTSSQKVQSLNRKLKEQEAQETDLVKRVEELSSLNQQYASDLQQRDMMVGELTHRQKSLASAYQSRIKESLDIVQKKDKVIQRKDQEIKEHLFKIGLVEKDNNKLRAYVTAVQREVPETRAKSKGGSKAHARSKQGQDKSAPKNGPPMKLSKFASKINENPRNVQLSPHQHMNHRLSYEDDSSDFLESEMSSIEASASPPTKQTLTKRSGREERSVRSQTKPKAGRHRRFDSLAVSTSLAKNPVITID